ncbi:MAG: FlgD immunoglobulin-like domain containing protein [candidate division Zixibacteria bacterium]
MTGRNSNLLSPLVLAAAFFVVLGSSVSVFAQDPDLPDSMYIGNPDGSVLFADINTQIAIPIWVKTDDSVTFVHIPLSTDDEYFTSRDDGILYPPFSLWDDVQFLESNADPQHQGWTNQSILGYAYISNPRDPQNFLYTNYEWVHIGDFLVQTLDDIGIYGDTTCLEEGFNPYYGPLLWGLQDGVTQFIPHSAFSCISFIDNIPPEIIEPEYDLSIAVNHHFPLTYEVIATDDEEDVIDLSLEFDANNYEFETIQAYPGYTHKRFTWIPQDDHVGTYTAVFTADDGNGGVVVRTITIESSPTVLDIPEVNVLLGMIVDIPINLDSRGISSYIGGFEILIRYDAPMISVLSVSRTERLADWDYFNVHFEDTSGIRIVGLADVTGNGIALPPGDNAIIMLHCYISDGDEFLGEYGWLRFLTNDSNDNTMSDTTGYLLIHPELDDGWAHAIGPDDVVIGDINLNEMAWEIADGILLANYLVDPEGFPLSPIQLIASNTNGDEDEGTVADLIFLLNVLLGEYAPPRINYGLDMNAVISIEDMGVSDDRFIVGYDSDIPAGGALIRIDHGGAEIGEVISRTDMNMQYSDKDGILSVLLFDMEGDYINPGTELFEFNIISGKLKPSFTQLQVSDRFGNQIPVEGRIETGLPDAYQLYGAYPNPFNASANISFSLPSVSDVELTIFNVLGQEVRSITVENMSPGLGSINWDGTTERGNTAASGVYLYRIEAGDFSATSRMVLLK